MVKRKSNPAPSREEEGYEDFLRLVGEKILAINKRVGRGHEQSLSTAVIRVVEKENGFSSGSFERGGFKTREEKTQVWVDLCSMDPRFDGIDVVAKKKRKRTINPLIRTEQLNEMDFIETALLTYLGSENRNGESSDEEKKLPKGTASFVSGRLNQRRKELGLPLRTNSSVRGHIDRIFYGRENPGILKGVRGSTHYGPTTTKKTPPIEEISEEDDRDKTLRDNLEKKLSTLDLSDTDESKGLLRDPGESDEDLSRRRKRQRGEYLGFKSRGHTELLAYLADPLNYRDMFGENTTLVQLDLRPEDRPREIYEEHSKKLKALEDITDEDSDVSEFVNGWLRTDMIFRRDLGNGEREYFVVEVKQNAIDTPNFKNAMKARQQLAAYRSTVLENVRMHNEENEHLREVEGEEDYIPVKERVEGVLVAYKIEKKTRDHLARTGDTRAIRVDKSMVREYIDLHHERSMVARAIGAYLEKRLSGEDYNATPEAKPQVEENFRNSYHDNNGVVKTHFLVSTGINGDGAIPISRLRDLRSTVEESDSIRRRDGARIPYMTIGADRKTLTHRDPLTKVSVTYHLTRNSKKTRRFIDKAISEGKISAA